MQFTNQSKKRGDLFQFIRTIGPVDIQISPISNGGPILFSTPHAGMDGEFEFFMVKAA